MCSVLILAVVTGTIPAAGRAEAPNTPPPSAGDASAYPGRLVRLPDGRRLNFRCSGAGLPAVILEGGFAATSLAWYKVQPLLAPDHEVCAYDRAGYGFSDPGPEPRDGAAIARDLNEGLNAAGLVGPFILVGHSAGALYVQLLTDLRPNDIAGMVLVDPSVEHQDAHFSAEFGPGAGSLAPLRARAQRCLEAAQAGLLPSHDPALTPCSRSPTSNQSAAVQAARLAEALRPSTWRTQISELDNLWTRTSDEVGAGGVHYDQMPFVVLTADGTYAGAPVALRARLLAFWRSLHQDLAARSARGRELLVDRSSHMMILDRPDAIARAVAEVSEESGRAR